MADAEGDTTRKHPFERGRLHGCECDVAQRHREYADADPHPLSPREGRCRAGDAALKKAVLPEPQLVEPDVVRRLRD